jgi:ribosomal protein RSM22 (predicted rRNA methylase)
VEFNNFNADKKNFMQHFADPCFGGVKCPLNVMDNNVNNFCSSSSWVLYVRWCFPGTECNLRTVTL